MAPTRVTVVEETLAEPKDFELYKQTYENVVLVGAGTYGSVYYVRLAFLHLLLLPLVHKVNS